MQLINLTRQLEIGANSYLLKMADYNILLDVGLHPKAAGMEALPNLSLLTEEAPDTIIVTHAHQDHVGSLPVVTRNHRDVRVYMTPPTARVADVMLHNSVNVMLRQREDANILEYPLFTHRGVELCSQSWEIRPTNRPFHPTDRQGNEISSLRMRFFDAGHILGSAGILIESEDQTFFYTGDVNFDAQTVLQGADFPEEGIDVLMMETTRGDSTLPEGFTRTAEEYRFAKAIEAAFDRNEAVTIPVFALGKTQELLAMLWKLQRQGLLPSVPIYIGGLSSKITSIYDALASGTRRNFPDLQLLHDLSLSVVGGKEIASLHPRKHCIFALSSGMMSENTLSNIFARRILESSRQSLFFVGYADPDSPAGQVRKAQKGENITLQTGQSPLKLQCHREEFHFSAHGSRDTLLAYAKRLRPKTIVLVHGDTQALEWFRGALSQDLPNTRIVLPSPGKVMDLCHC